MDGIMPEAVVNVLYSDAKPLSCFLIDWLSRHLTLAPRARLLTRLAALTPDTRR